MGAFTGYYTHRGDDGELDLYEGETTTDEVGYVTDLLSGGAAALVADADDTPWFLRLHYTAPHWPWSAPSVEAAAREREVDQVEWKEGGSLRIYAEMMGILDAGISRVMDAVRNSGRETLVIFTSDNGGERYSKMWPFVGRNWDLLEGGSRVPQIVWWPGRVQAGLVSDQVTITMDFSATCLAAAGVAPDPTQPLDGLDLAPLLAPPLAGQQPVLQAGKDFGFGYLLEADADGPPERLLQAQDIDGFVHLAMGAVAHVVGLGVVAHLADVAFECVKIEDKARRLYVSLAHAGQAGAS